MSKQKFRDDIDDYVINEWAKERGICFVSYEEYENQKHKKDVRIACIQEYLECHKTNVKNLNEWLKESKGNEPYLREGFVDTSNYVDPDPISRRLIEGYDCSADGLHSIYRISKWYDVEKHEYFEDVDDIVDVYDRYRKVPIFHFPPAKGEHRGINNERSLWPNNKSAEYFTYSDRIDLFLFDLKLWFKYYYDEGNKDTACSKCKMYRCYLEEITETRAWLDALNIKAKTEGYTDGFEYLMDEVYNVRGIFVDEKFDVYDIESNELIDEETNWGGVREGGWSKVFYENLKAKIDAWYKRQGFFSN